MVDSVIDSVIFLLVCEFRARGQKPRKTNLYVGGRTYNHADDSVHQLVIHPYNAKQPLLQHQYDGIPPLDGQIVFVQFTYTHF